LRFARSSAYAERFNLNFALKARDRESLCRLRRQLRRDGDPGDGDVAFFVDQYGIVPRFEFY
jgi:hypothetical protein